MMRAATAGVTTVVGTALAIWATYQDVRLDWAETALVVGVGLFVYGACLAWRMVCKITEE